MPRRSLRATLRLACTLFVCLAVVVASAPRRGLAEGGKRDKKTEAKAHYEAGIRKFDLGKYDEAADEFEAAYEAVGEPAILYNVAQSCRLGERFEKSARFYRSFLRRVTDLPNRAEIEGRIVEMDERAADQKRRAERQAEEKRDADRRSADSHETADKPEHRPTRGPVQSEHPGRTLRIVGYSLAGLTAASLGVGITMSVLAGKASSKVQSAATAHAMFTTDLRDTESHGKLYDTVAIVGYAVAGAAAIGTAVSLYFGLRAGQREHAAAPRRIAWPILAPSVSTDGGGLVLMGRF